MKFNFDELLLGSFAEDRSITIKAAGLAVVANDTGRLLMLQRAITDDDPASGKWEFPGGTLELGEHPRNAALREWQEETGHELPFGRYTGDWTSPNGVYKLYVYLINAEDMLTLNLDHEDRHVINPDDTDGDYAEVIAWWHPEDLQDNPALREEAKETDWNLFKTSITAHGNHDQSSHGNWSRGGDESILARVHPNTTIKHPSSTGSNRESRLEGVKTMSIIGRLHRVDVEDVNDKVKIDFTDEPIHNDERILGEYEPASNEITIRNNPEFARTALSHEFGHYLSKGPPGMFDQGSDYIDEGVLEPKFQDFQRAVVESETFRHIAGNLTDDDPGYAGYLSTNEEVWARAYSQWVAVKSGDKVMQNQIARLGKDTGYWVGSDFDGVFDAMEDIFRKEQLLK